MAHPDRLSADTPHFNYPTVGSTNDEALVRYSAGQAAPFWLTADQQSTGKGRQGRQWQSPGGTLSATLLLTDPAPAAKLPQLAFVTALAMADAIDQRTLSGLARFKWPNDLLIDRAKICGILLEARLLDGRQVVIIGAGVNCLAAPKQVAFPCTSLREQGFEIQPALLFDSYRAAMASWLDMWAAGENFDTVRQQWLERAVGIDEPIRVSLPLARPIEGRFVGLDADGRLELSETETGKTHKISAGDVFFVDRHEGQDE